MYDFITRKSEVQKQYHIDMNVIGYRMIELSANEENPLLIDTIVCKKYIICVYFC